jgi:hypothetical protein
MVLSLFTIAVMVGLAPTGASQPADDSKVEKKATDILKQASDLIKNAKTLHMDTKVVFTLEDGQGKRAVHSEGSCDLEQPNHFALRLRRAGAEGGVNCVCDGKSLFTSAIVMKQYTESPAPADLYKMGAALMTIDMRNTGMLLQNVLGEDPYEQLMDGVNTCAYAGKEKVGDAEAHHLTFTQDAFNWEIWIAAEGKPVVLKTHSHGDTGNGGRFDLVESFANWKFDEAPAKDTFTFSPPKDAKKVQNLESGVEKK